MHEASLHKHNCFVTLTYDDASLPPGYDLRQGLVYRHFQLFMKRLRKRFGPVRFYMCGEYGGKNGRPHFHVLLFGFRFPEEYFWTTRNSNRSFRSRFLDGMPPHSIDRSLVDPELALWPWGNAEFGDVNFKSSAYVARYIMKKVTGRAADEHYESFDPDTGEVFNRVPEFNSMSRRPGIAAGWISQFHSDVFPMDAVIVNGRKTKPPRFYDNFLRDFDLSAYEDLKYERELDALDPKRLLDSTPERLAAKERCTVARVSRLKRTLD
jgi:hypothetical protein